MPGVCTRNFVGVCTRNIAWGVHQEHFMPGVCTRNFVGVCTRNISCLWCAPGTFHACGVHQGQHTGGLEAPAPAMPHSIQCPRFAYKSPPYHGWPVGSPQGHGCHDHLTSRRGPAPLMVVTMAATIISCYAEDLLLLWSFQWRP